MRSYESPTRRPWFSAAATAAAVALAIASCGDSPVDPGAPQLDHAGNHPADAGPPAISVAVVAQPTVDKNPSSEDCRIRYGFEIVAKKPATVRWETTMIGGEHDGVMIGRNTADVGGKAGPYVADIFAGHPNDGHSFDALRIQVLEPPPSLAFIAETFTDGATISC